MASVHQLGTRLEFIISRQKRDKTFFKHKNTEKQRNNYQKEKLRKIYREHKISPCLFVFPV